MLVTGRVALPGALRCLVRPLWQLVQDTSLWAPDLWKPPMLAWQAVHILVSTFSGAALTTGARATAAASATQALTKLCFFIVTLLLATFRLFVLGLVGGQTLPPSLFIENR